MAVGMLIDAETRLKNDEVIEEILSASAGFIESYEELSSKERDDGLWQVQARVVVRKNLLRKRLVTSKVITEKVDGGSLFASAMSRANNASATASIIAKNLADYPLCAMKVALNAPPEVLDNEGAEWIIGLQVLVSVDQDGWAKSANALRTALQNIASGTEPVDLGLRTRDLDWRDELRSIRPVAPLGHGERSQGLRNISSLVAFRTDKKHHAPDEFVIVLPRSSRVGDRCDAFTVPRSLIPEIGRLWGRDVTLFIEFKNAEGAVIHRHATPCPAKVGFSLGDLDTTKVEGAPTGWFGRLKGEPLKFNPAKEPVKGEWGAKFGSSNNGGSIELLFNEVAVVPNFVVTHDNQELGEECIARLALKLQPSILEQTTAVDLRLESSERPWSVVYAPRTDAQLGYDSAWMSIPVLPLENETQEK
jgi:hypothetical protein